MFEPLELIAMQWSLAYEWMQKQAREGSRGCASVHAFASPRNCLAASMCASVCASIRASVCASVRASACPCNCLAACLCLGISLYCSSLLHTPQASLPLPSSLETVQPPNDPNNHTHRPLFRLNLLKNSKTQGIDKHLQTRSSHLHLQQI